MTYKNEFEQQLAKSQVLDAIQMVLLRRRYSRQPVYRPDQKAQKIPQNLVGLTASGDFIDVIFKNTNFTFGDLFMTSMGCVDVGALDGGPNASMYVNDKIKSRSGNEQENDVPNFLLIYKL